MKNQKQEDSVISSFVDILFSAFLPKTLKDTDLPKDKRKREKYYNNGNKFSE